MTVLDGPDKALETVCALTVAGLGVEQVGLVALAPVMDACATVSASWTCAVDGASGLFRHLQELCRLGDGEPLVATSATLLEPIRETIVPSAATRTSERRNEIERLLLSGAVALVAKAADSRQQQTITRLLLASSRHRVTTYDLPSPAARI